jgi:hypothetical protein
MQAAMIYQHATAEADQAIADALHEAVEAEREKTRQAGEKATKKNSPKRRVAPDVG